MTTHARRGAEAIEFALTIPVLLLLAGGIIDFGWFTTHQSSIQAAASVGARAASRTPSDEDPESTAKLFAQRSLDDARITDATVETQLTNLANGDAAIEVRITAPYSGLWGFLPLDVDYDGRAVYRLDDQP